MTRTRTVLAAVATAMEQIETAMSVYAVETVPEPWVIEEFGI